METESEKAEGGSMPKREDDGHIWVCAATMPVPSSAVRQVYKRGTYRVRAELRVSVEEVYCSACRKTYERAAGKVCEAIASREHLIGGPTGRRSQSSPAVQLAVG